MGLPPGDADPYLEQFSDSEWDVPEDPPELQAARNKLDIHRKCASEGVLNWARIFAVLTRGITAARFMKAPEITLPVGISADGSEQITAMPSIAETDPEDYKELLENMNRHRGSGRIDSANLNPSMAVAAAQLNATLSTPQHACLDKHKDQAVELPIPALERLAVDEARSLHELD